MSEDDVQGFSLRLEPSARHQREKDVVIEEFQESGKRKRWLFWGVVGFLVVNALAFFVVLFWAFWLVAYKDADWHLLGFAALPGILLATVAIMALRAIYNVGSKEGVHEMSPMLQTFQNVKGDFSS